MQLQQTGTYAKERKKEDNDMRDMALQRKQSIMPL